jgi:hypothetical protein
MRTAVGNLGRRPYPARWFRATAKGTRPDLEGETGLQVHSAFAYEFHLSGLDEHSGNAFSLEQFRLAEGLVSTAMAALRQARAEPEAFMTEYGPARGSRSPAARPSGSRRQTAPPVFERDPAEAAADERERLGARRRPEPLEAASRRSRLMARSAPGYPLTCGTVT